MKLNFHTHTQFDELLVGSACSQARFLSLHFRSCSLSFTSLISLQHRTQTQL